MFKISIFNKRKYLNNGEEQVLVKARDPTSFDFLMTLRIPT